MSNMDNHIKLNMMINNLNKIITISTFFNQFFRWRLFENILYGAKIRLHQLSALHWHESMAVPYDVSYLLSSSRSKQCL